MDERAENLKFLLRHGKEAMTAIQIADALKEANELISKSEKMENALKSIHETDSLHLQRVSNNEVAICHFDRNPDDCNRIADTCFLCVPLK